LIGGINSHQLFLYGCNLPKVNILTTEEILVKLQKEGHDPDALKCCSCDDLIHYQDTKAELYWTPEGEPMDYDDAEHEYLDDGQYVEPTSKKYTGESICKYCFQNVLDGVDSSMTIYTVDALDKPIHFKYGFNAVCYGNINEEYPEDASIMDDAKKLMSSIKYKSTGGWYGYNEAHPDDNEIIHLDMGFNWLSGHHSAVKEVKKKDLFEKAIGELKIPIFAITVRTGNFAAYTDLYARKANEKDLNKISTFINDFVGDRDPRWDVGVIMHFDSDNLVGQKAIKDLESQLLPEWWKWQLFLDHYDVIKDEAPKFNKGSFKDLQFDQQIGVMSGSPLGLTFAKLLLLMKQTEE